MKSACEVQVEILNQEKQALVDEIEDFKDQIAQFTDEINLVKIQYENDPEKAAMSKKVIELQAD